MNKETLEEAAERNHNEQKLNTYTPYSFNDAFKDGAKWQAERMYSEEDIRNAMERVWYWHEDNQDKDCPTLYELILKHIQSLQQTK